MDMSRQLTDLDTPWRTDPAVQEAVEREQMAEKKAAALDAQYRAAWAEAVADATEGGVTVAPSFDDPVWPIRRQSARADKEARAARLAREAAEAQARQVRQRLGYRLGYRKMQQGIRDYLLPLAAWCMEYETVRVEVSDKYGVTLPHLPHVLLTERDITEMCASIFSQNRFGSSLLSEEDK
jgi:hypothetical protein